MSNADKTLADMLGVGTDAINSLSELMGENYNEIYNTLVREYTLYTIMENIQDFSIVMMYLTLVPIIILLVSYTEFPDSLNYKSIFKVCCIVMVVLILAILIANILSPMLAPNIHIIKEIGG